MEGLLFRVIAWVDTARVLFLSTGSRPSVDVPVVRVLSFLPALVLVVACGTEPPAAGDSQATASDDAACMAVDPNDSDREFTDGGVLIDAPEFAVEPGETVEVPLVFEDAPLAGLVLFLSEVEGVSAEVCDAELESGDFLGVTALGIHLANPVDGPLTVTNDGPAEVTGGVMLIIESERRLSVEFEPPHPKPGEEVTVRVVLTEPSPEDAPRVRITTQGEVVFEADPDPVGTGIWEVSFTPPEDRGYSVSAWVEGPRPRFESTPLLFAVESPSLIGVPRLPDDTPFSIYDDDPGRDIAAFLTASQRRLDPTGDEQPGALDYHNSGEVDIKATLFTPLAQLRDAITGWTFHIYDLEDDLVADYLEVTSPDGQWCVSFPAESQGKHTSQTGECPLPAEAPPVPTPTTGSSDGP